MTVVNNEGFHPSPSSHIHIITQVMLSFTPLPLLVSSQNFSQTLEVSSVFRSSSLLPDRRAPSSCGRGCIRAEVMCRNVALVLAELPLGVTQSLWTS